jgi:hypothetical protein
MAYSNGAQGYADGAWKNAVNTTKMVSRIKIFVSQ